MLTLVLGGARSGKSAYAERAGLALAERLGCVEPTYLATAEPFDAEMRARIARHRLDRGGAWRTVEAPRDIEATLRREARPDRLILIDCLTLWLSNEMLREPAPDDEEIDRRMNALSAALRNAPGAIIAVSNEVGLGLVPETAIGRRFRDAQGRLNQKVAAQADRVIFVAAGLPLALKGETPV